MIWALSEQSSSVNAIFSCEHHNISIACFSDVSCHSIQPLQDDLSYFKACLHRGYAKSRTDTSQFRSQRSQSDDLRRKLQITMWTVRILQQKLSINNPTDHTVYSESKLIESVGPIVTWTAPCFHVQSRSIISPYSECAKVRPTWVPCSKSLEKSVSVFAPSFVVLRIFVSSAKLDSGFDTHVRHITGVIVGYYSGYWSRSLP